MVLHISIPHPSPVSLLPHQTPRRWLYVLPPNKHIPNHPILCLTLTSPILPPPPNPATLLKLDTLSSYFHLRHHYLLSIYIYSPTPSPLPFHITTHPHYYPNRNRHRYRINTTLCSRNPLAPNIRTPLSASRLPSPPSYSPTSP
jgi:hypothetical protein